jgi:phosphoglycolate phosphatase-like HAD superfamily hydrolase
MEPEDQSWSSAGFKIVSRSLSPPELSERIGLFPTRATSKGTPISSRDPTRLRNESVWLLERKAEPAERLEALLAELLDLLEPRAEALAALEPGCRMVYLRPDAEAAAALRTLAAAGYRIGVFTDAPAELARVALAHLGAARRIEALEAGANARRRVLERLGGDARVAAGREELVRLAGVGSAEP